MAGARSAVSVWLLYLLLLKATCTSFSGLASLPSIRADLVERHHVLSDQQLNAALAAGRSGPGPLGIYVVCVGYQVAGVPGAVAGLLAAITPAFFIIALLRGVGGAVTGAALQRTIRAIIAAAAGLLAATTIDLAASGITGAFTAFVAAASFVALVFTRVDTLWVMLGAAALGAAHKLITG